MMGLFTYGLAPLWRYPLSAPTLHQLLQTISLLYGRWSTSGSNRGIAHFFTATRYTIEGAGEKEQTNKMLGLTQVQKGSYVTLCMCRQTLAWVTSKNSTTLLECQLIFPHCGWTLSHADSSLYCPVLTGHSRRQLPTSLLLSCSLTGIPFLLPVTPRSQVQNPLSGFAPKQTKESSAWRTTYTVLHLCFYLSLKWSYQLSLQVKNTRALVDWNRFKLLK